MKITTKHLFDYVQSNSRPMPKLDWVCDLDRRSNKSLRDVLNAFKASVLVRLCRPLLTSVDQVELKTWKNNGGKESLRLYAGRSKLGADENNFVRLVMDQMMEDFIDGERDYIYELHVEIQDAKQAMDIIYQLSCEAFGRRASVFTPQDVGAFMARLAGKVEAGIDVYCNYGYGMFLGAKSERGDLVNLVGAEIGEINSLERTFPGRLKDVYEQSQFVIDREAIYERMSVEASWNFSDKRQSGEVLLLNASTEDYPFGFASDRELPGELNFVFNGQYKKIIVLVSNILLNGGRSHGIENISKYFRKNGLVSVIELPAGCAGAMHERHSILVFEPKTKNQEIQFRSLDLDIQNAEPVYRPARRGFGHPLRKLELNLKAFSSDGETSQEHKNYLTEESIFSAHSNSLNQRNRNQFVSFEASRYLIKNKLPEDFIRQFQMSKLDSLVSIHRVQHMEIASDPNAILCNEISSDDINEFGVPGPGKKKLINENSVRRLEKSRLKKGDILFCIRGPVGKLALIQSESLIPLVSTQNFLRLRLRDDCEEKLITPEFLFWWLRSDICQGLIKNLEISAGVLRLSMRDIEDLVVPIGPAERVLQEMEKYQKFVENLQTFMFYENKVRDTTKKSFM